MTDQHELETGYTSVRVVVCHLNHFTADVLLDFKISASVLRPSKFAKKKDKERHSARAARLFVEASCLSQTFSLIRTSLFLVNQKRLLRISICGQGHIVGHSNTVRSSNSFDLDGRFCSFDEH